MSTLSVRLTDSLHKELKELAKQEGVSMNQFINLAVSERLTALLTVDYLKERAEKKVVRNLEKLWRTSLTWNRKSTKN